MTNRRNLPARWVLPGTVHPTGTKCIQIQIPDERYYVAAFRGAMLNLASAHQWADDEAHTAAEVAKVWRNVINNMTDECGAGTGCRDEPPSASFIDWVPQDPFTQPDFTPDGYLLPPFYVVTAGSPANILGYQVGDVLTDITRIPVGTGVIVEPTSGWARFRIHLRGIGIATLQFLNVPLGGGVLVTEDDNPLTAVFIELNLDLVDLPPENNFLVGNEHRFTDHEEHHIDVTFLPRFNDEAPAVFWGGGLRAVTLCGFEEMMFDIRQKPDSPCIIQKTDDGETWVDTVDMTKCPVNVRVNLGIVQWFNPITLTWETTDGGDERSTGTSEPPYPDNPDGACLAAENITAIYQTALTELRAGLVASEVAVAVAATITGIMSLFIPAAIVSTIALAITGLALDIGEAGLDDMLDEAHLDNFKCVILCNIEADGSVTAAEFTAIRNGMAGWASSVELAIIQFWLDGFGSVGLTRQGRAGGITTADCGDCACTSCHEWDFSTGNAQGWSAYISTLNGLTRATLTSTGWEQGADTAFGQLCQIYSPLFSSAVPTRTLIYISAPAPSGLTAQFYTGQGNGDAPGADVAFTVGQTFAQFTGYGATAITALWCGIFHSSGNLGGIKITKIHMEWGAGSDPDLSDNC